MCRGMGGRRRRQINNIVVGTAAHMAHRRWGRKKPEDARAARGIDLKRRMQVEVTTAMAGDGDEGWAGEDVARRRTEALRRASAAGKDGDFMAVLDEVDAGAVVVVVLTVGITTGALRHAASGERVEWEDVPRLLEGANRHGAEWVCDRIDVVPGPSFLLILTQAIAASGREAAAAWSAAIEADRDLLGGDGIADGADRGVARAKRRY